MARVLIGNVKPVKGVDYLTEEDITELGEYFAPVGYVSGQYAVNAAGELDGILAEIYGAMTDRTQKVINAALYATDGLPGGNWFITIKKTTNDYGHMEASEYSLNGSAPCICRRSIYAGTWGEWAFENPPMETNVEYSTTELRNHKAVYTKIVQFGNMPNATTKSIAHGLDVAIPIRCNGVYNNISTIPCKFGEVEVSVSFDTENIYVHSATDLSAYTGYIQLWYTKN